MNPIIKIRRSGFESFIKQKLPVGSNYGYYVRSLDARIRKFYKDKMNSPLDSIYVYSDENEIFKIKQDIASHPSMVYLRGHNGDKRIEGLDWYIEFLRIFSGIPHGELERSSGPCDIHKATSDMEGKHIKREATVINRNPDARRKCIEYYGCRCVACGIAMRERYGEIGEGFIEVHHRNPIHLFDETHPVNYIEDLIPLCPNCHAMIHKLADPGDVNTLKDILKANKKD